MLTVALCDDDAAQLKQTVALLHKYMQQRPDLQLRLSAFTSGKELLLAEECTGFDLYLLDVLMPERNGIETGLRLREQGAKGEIIYLTTSREYAVESYQVQAFFYLVKPVEKDQFFQVLDQATDRLARRRRDHILIHTSGGSQILPLDHILYAERAGRTVCYHCLGGKTLFGSSLRGAFRKEMAPLLEDKRFLLCGASFVLNLAHVSKISGNTALLDDGRELPLPQRLSRQIKLSWMDFWIGGVVIID